MHDLPEATLRWAKDLTNSRKGRRAAERAGEAAARRALRSSGVLGPSAPRIDVARVVTDAGIRIVQASSIKESGRIEWVDDQLRIVLKSSDGKRRQRFTLAHEFAHYAIFGIPQSGERVYSDEEERRCDRFATGMLMPKRAFQASFDTLRQISRSAVVCDMADRFDVSLATALRRFRELGVGDPVSVILLFESRGIDDYQVTAAAYDSGTYGRLESMMASDMRLSDAIARGLAMRPGSRRSPASPWLPTKARGYPNDGRMILPSVVTCIPLGGSGEQGQRRLLVEIEPVVDPIHPRIRLAPSLIQAELA